MTESVPGKPRWPDEIGITTSWGTIGGFALGPMSVAGWHERFFGALAGAGVAVTIDEKPQEVADPVPLPQDPAPRPYDHALVEAWFQTMHTSAGVMERYRACFNRKTPPIGLMWGTFDLRDTRLGGTSAPRTRIPGQRGLIPTRPTTPSRTRGRRGSRRATLRPRSSPSSSRPTRPGPSPAGWDAALICPGRPRQTPTGDST